MEILVIVAVVVGVAWFAVPRLASRRRAEDDAYARGGFGMGMLSWLPAWMIIGGALNDGHDGDRGADAGASGGSHSGGSDWGGGGGGDSGSFGGGDVGGGGFGGGGE